MSESEASRKTREQAAWRAHRLAQLRRFQVLTLRQKLEAVEGMADVWRRFQEMREKGQFTGGK